jgi:hypothetical protein
MSEGLRMHYRHEERSGVERAPERRVKAGASIEPGVAPEDFGRLANLGLLTVVLILAALWFAFPPAQLSGSRTAGPVLAQGAPASDLPR